MKRFLLAVAVLALVAAESQAGPFRNLFHRFQERRAARVSGSCSSCQSAPVAAYSTSPATAPRSCPDGRCPLRSETPAIEQPASPPPAVVESSVVVFATPRRMP